MRYATFPIPTAAETRRFFLKLAVAAVVCYLIYAVRELWLPLALALILAMVLNPVVDRMEIRGWNRTLASAFIFSAFLIITIGLAILVAPYVDQQAAEMQAQFEKYFPDPSPTGVLRSLHRMDVPDTLARAGMGAYEALQGGVEKSSTAFSTYGMQFAGNLIWVVIIPIVAFYALRDFNVILAKSLLVLPTHNRPAVQSAVVEATGIFGRYLRALGLVSVLNGLTTFCLLYALGVPSAIILGIVAGILYSVPYLGAIITVALTAAVAFLSGGVHMALVAVGASIVLHQIVFDQIISPRILGAHVGLHPILSIVALLAGNLLLGIVGMILAVPVAACIQIAVVSVLPKLAIDVEIPVPTMSAEEEAAEDGVVAPFKDKAMAEMKAAVASAVEKAEESAAEPGESILAEAQRTLSPERGA